MRIQANEATLAVRPFLVSLAVAILGTVFSGCLSSGGVEGTVPLARLGDFAVYETAGKKQTFRIAWLEHPPVEIGLSHQILRIETSDDDGRPLDLIVNPLSNTIAASYETCPRRANGQCWENYTIMSRSAEGFPWAWGSSLFQGLSLKEGMTFARSFWSKGTEFEVRFRVLEASLDSGGVRFRVRGESNVGAIPIPVHGEWVLHTALPFAKEFSQEVEVYSGKKATLMRRTLQLIDYVQGSGQMLPPPSDGFHPLGPILATERGDVGLPAGSATALGWRGYRFRDAANFLIANVEEFRMAARDPNFRIVAAQVPIATSSATVIGTQETTTSSFQYAIGSGSGARWNVDWFCEVSPLADPECRFQNPRLEQSTSVTETARVERFSANLAGVWSSFNETLHQPASGFGVRADWNRVPDPERREEFHTFIFYYTIAAKAGIHEFGSAEYDGKTGRLSLAWLPK